MRVLLVARDPTPVLEPLAHRWPEIEWVVVPSPYLETLDMKHIEVAYLWDYRSRLFREIWDRMPALRWVHVASAGVDAMLFPGMLASDAILTNSRGAFDQSVAEFTLGLVLAMSKHLNVAVANQLERRWEHGDTQLLSGRTALIVGFGSIGSLIGRMLHAFGMRVVGIRRSGQPHPDADEMFTLAALPEQLGRAQYVILVLPMTSETTQLIGQRELAMMRPDSVLINVGRGSVLDEQALAAALTAGSIGGAALDVFEREPLAPDHPFWTTPNTLITPHMASDSDDWRARIMDVFSENLRRYMGGEPLLNVIDKERGY